MTTKDADIAIIDEIEELFTKIVAETNGITISETLELLCQSKEIKQSNVVLSLVREFRDLISSYQFGSVSIDILLQHPVSKGIEKFFRKFPKKYHEEHIHLTGSLNSDFVYEGLQAVLDSKDSTVYQEKIKNIFGDVKIESPADVEKLIVLADGEEFDRYLRILDLPALILKDKSVHKKAAYHMARELYTKYNVGHLKLKFTFSRVASDPKIKVTSSRDVVLGLYEGFKEFADEVGDFSFNLSPSFRKEANYFDRTKFRTKKEAFEHSISELLSLLQDHPELYPYLNEVDTVGNEREMYRKGHFRDMQDGFRRLQRRGFQIRSHHGEVWKTLAKGVQAVDNAMNIWHLDNLEHGISLGINPNYYYHSLKQRILENNLKGEGIAANSRDFYEITEMDWKNDYQVMDKLVKGVPINVAEEKAFTKAKFRTATEVERYQHDVLNRMIHKNISLVALPSSNKRLTGNFSDYKDHPFSWWEKKGVRLGVGTDNYITLGTNFTQEMLILLYSDPYNLKIMKLLMVTTKEPRRPYLSHLLWRMVHED